MEQGTQTTTELRLAQIWNDLLQRSESIQSHEGFFDVGGDSISVLMMLMRVTQDFGVDLSPDYIFENPPLSAIASDIDKRISGESGTPTTGIL